MKFFLLLLFVIGLLPVASAQTTNAPTVPAPLVMSPTLTPPPPHSPLIHGPKIFGVRPKSPFLYTIPATGDRPMTFSVDNLPASLNLDAASGRITGTLTQTGTFPITFHAENVLGKTSRNFKIVVGDTIALTPPMGWNSWNCWGSGISQVKVLRSAHAIIKAGLDEHGWTYVNMDDAWQGRRGGEFNAIQPDPKPFPDIKAMADEIHGLGLKVGLYSTPWVISYAGHVGGSSENVDGAFDKNAYPKRTPNKKILPDAIAPYHFFTNDAKQWAAWGIDYLKFDWAPNELPETTEMAGALRAAGRDVVFSLSNNSTNSLFDIIGDMSNVANCWRIGGDITDTWGSMAGHGFHQDKWAPFEKPGHWNDPDMLEIGANGGGKPKRLTADEQYTHISIWCLVSAPLLLGCDLDYLDDFTLGLITNDEVIDVDQDELGKEATLVARQGDLQVYAKPLADGSWAVGLFNLGPTESQVMLKWSDIGISGPQTVRDLWRQKDLGEFTDSFASTVASHGVTLVRVISTK